LELGYSCDIALERLMVLTCPPKRYPVIMLVWKDKKGDKWSGRTSLRNRSSTS
jgi:hypothetical protein